MFGAIALALIGPARLSDMLVGRNARATNAVNSLRAKPLIILARDGLHQLAEMYRRGLAILDDNQSLFIARGEAEHIVSTAVRVGAYLPLYCSATGPVLLGGRSDGEIRQRLGQRPIIARTPHGLSTTADILSTIRAAAECGYAISDEELALGLDRWRCPYSVQRETSLRR